MKKRCEHQWMPIGRDVYICSKCGVIKENYVAELKHQLAEKDKQLEIYKNLKRYDIGELLNENIKLRAKINTSRHQVCEEIRHEIQAYLRKNNLLKLELVFGIDFIIKQIEGENNA